MDEVMEGLLEERQLQQQYDEYFSDEYDEEEDWADDGFEL